MSKLEITEVQIDKYNDTYKKFINFKSGLNVVTGDNEVGKSTLMSFITNIFKRKSDADGYLKCVCDNEEIKLDAKKSKQKNNVPCLEKVTSKNFEQGFFIDLDDLMQLKLSTSDLLEIIKDSSGAIINQKQSEYDNFITKGDFSLTQKNAPSTNFKKQFNYLKEITQSIEELQKQENEYNSKNSQAVLLKEEINNIDSEVNYLQLALKLKEYKSSNEELSINKDLLNNTNLFSEVKEKFYSIKSKRDNYLDAKSSIKNYNENVQSEYNELENIEKLSKEDIKNFDVSQCAFVQKLQSDILTVSSDIKNIEDKIKDRQELINKLTFTVDTYNNKINDLAIDNIETYSKDKAYLKEYLNEYYQKCEELNNSDKIKTTVSSTALSIIILLFGFGFLTSFFFSGLVNLVFALICVMGLAFSVKEKYFTKSVDNKSEQDIEKIKSKISVILNNHGCNNSDIIVATKVFIDEMENKISEFNKLIQEKSEKENEVTSLNSELENLFIEQKRLKENLDTLLNDRHKFAKNMNISDIDSYNEVVTLVRNINILNEKISEKEKFINSYENEVKDFVSKLNSFIEITNISVILPVCNDEYDNFESTVLNIQNILDKNINNSVIIQSRLDEIEKIKLKLSEFNVKDIDISEEMLNSLKLVLADKKSELAVCLNDISKLKTVESLVEIKNKKFAELNRLKSRLRNLFVKEMVLEIIKKSKEEFNQVQPNLISAKKYLAQITNNKYSEIDFDNMTISGENIADKSWADLSKGTKEQLYLSLRLGYVENYSKDKYGNETEKPILPLIIDDAFVNFDRTRIKSVLKCLETFAKNNQIIYFTCHSNLVSELLKEENIEFNHIKLE